MGWKFMADVRLELSVVSSLRVEPSPEIVQFAQMLALLPAGIERLVEEALASNPALERVQRDLCQACWRAVHRTDCLSCGGRREASIDAGGAVADPTDSLGVVAHCETASEDRHIVDAVLHGLDGHGFLGMSVTEYAQQACLPAPRVERVVCDLRAAIHPALAASGPREGLLLQVLQLGHEAPPRTLDVLSRSLDELASKQFQLVADRLGIPRAQVLEIWDFVRARLDPYPLPARNEGPRPAPPDVVVAERDGDFDVELTEPYRFGLRIDPAFEVLDFGSSQELTRAAEFVREGRLTIQRLAARWTTLELVAEEVVRQQKDFLLRGPSHMRRLTRAQVASAVGMHPATVGRAVSGRTIMLPSREVVPMSHLFQGTSAVYAQLRRVVETESRPLTDSELARELGKCGFPVARRTAAKYRVAIGIPAHDRR